MKRIYLASPYWDSDPNIRSFRFKRACHVAAELMRRKYIVFSPIAHSHPINKYGELGGAATYGLWMMQDLPFVKWADELWIITLGGYSESKGIGIEMRYARKLGKPIKYIEPITLCLTTT